MATTDAVNVQTLRTCKANGEKFACLTAYDATFARLLDAAGIDVILVGDSLGMVVQGHATTVPVTVDDVAYHCRAAARGKSRALLMADLPFMSYTTEQVALHNCARLMREGMAEIIKIEVGPDQTSIVEALADNGVPVCAHIGLTPQFFHKLGGFKVQGRDAEHARALVEQARALESAGADNLLVEAVPAAVGDSICDAVSIPVIGIGAGSAPDGQILVLHDILGVSPRRLPRFCREFLSGAGSVSGAVEAFVEAVKSGQFPGRVRGLLLSVGITAQRQVPAAESGRGRDLCKALAAILPEQLQAVSLEVVFGSRYAIVLEEFDAARSTPSTRLVRRWPSEQNS